MKKRIFLMGLLLSFLTGLQAQKPIILPVWEQGAPESNGLTTNSNEKDAGRTQHTNEAQLYVYPAAHPNGMTIVCCPGGGYAHLAMQHEGTDMATWMNSQGITLAVLQYRMPNGHKNVPSSDAYQAIRLLKQHAEEWHIDSNKIGIMGASAGGHLAATVANLAPADVRPAFQILLYPVITMGEGTHQGSRENLLGKQATETDVHDFSMELRVNEQTPKAFIALSSDDRAVPPGNSLNYATSLGKAGIPYSLHVYPIGGHGWGFRDSFPYKRQWTGELEKWLREINQ